MRCGLGVWVFLGAGWMNVVLWVWVMQVLDSWTNGFFFGGHGGLRVGTIWGGGDTIRGLEAVGGRLEGGRVDGEHILVFGGSQVVGCGLWVGGIRRWGDGGCWGMDGDRGTHERGR